MLWAWEGCVHRGVDVANLFFLWCSWSVEAVLSIGLITEIHNPIYIRDGKRTLSYVGR